jgi:hypothetical protein
MKAFVAALIAALLVASGAAAESCRDEVGVAQAQRYVEECLDVSPATHPPCNARNSCALILAEIARGCRLLPPDPPPPPFCRPFLSPPPEQH